MKERWQFIGSIFYNIKTLRQEAPQEREPVKSTCAFLGVRRKLK